MASDGILTFDDYVKGAAGMPGTELIMAAGRREYDHYLADYHRAHRGEDLPIIPGGALPDAVLQVNAGRWVWQCEGCDGGTLVKPGAAVICVHCGGQWRTPQFPAERATIEAELLKQPGRRLFAPVRNWKPGWTLAQLQARTARANELAATQRLVRSLSIGATRVWVAGEVLSATNFNLYVSGVMDDLAGRNGPVDFEDSLRVLDGADGNRTFQLPAGTTAQRPTTGLQPGLMRWNETLRRVDMWNGTEWINFGGREETILSNGFTITSGVKTTINLTAPNTLDNLNWLLMTSGEDADSLDFSVRIPTGVIQQKPAGGGAVYAGFLEIDGDFYLYRVNLATGALTSVGSDTTTFVSNGYPARGMGLLKVNDAVYAGFLEDDGDFYLYRVNLATGALTSVGSDTTTFVSNGNTARGMGLLKVNDAVYAGFLEDDGDFYLYRVNLATGALTSVGSDTTTFVSNGNTARGMGLLEVNRAVYAGFLEIDGDFYLYRVNLATGALTSVGSDTTTFVSNGNAAQGMGLLEVNGAVYAGFLEDNGDFYLYRVNLATGALTSVGSDTTTFVSNGNTARGMGLLQFDGIAALPYTSVDEYVLLQKDGATALEFTALANRRVHILIGVT